MKRIAFALLVIALAGCAHSMGSDLPAAAVGSEPIPTGAAPPPPPLPPGNEALAFAEAQARAATEREQRQREQAREFAGRQAAERAAEAIAHSPGTAMASGAAASGSRAIPDAAAASGTSPIGDALPPETDEVDALFARLRDGNVAFNAPQSVNIRDTIKVRALVSPDEAAETMKAQIDAPGMAMVRPVKVSKFMEARLTGEGFRIVPISQAQQAVGSGITAWEWEVTPQKEGLHRLTLSLDAFVRMDGERVARTRTFEHPIDVEVTMSQRIGGWVDQHGKWAWSALLVPLWAWWGRRRKAKPTPETA